jgi:hypothetical protein
VGAVSCALVLRSLARPRACAFHACAIALAPRRQKQQRSAGDEHKRSWSAYGLHTSAREGERTVEQDEDGTEGEGDDGEEELAKDAPGARHAAGGAGDVGARFPLDGCEKDEKALSCARWQTHGLRRELESEQHSSGMNEDIFFEEKNHNDEINSEFNLDNSAYQSQHHNEADKGKNKPFGAIGLVIF